MADNTESKVVVNGVNGVKVREGHGQPNGHKVVGNGQHVEALPRVVNSDFEHLNNFMLLNDGREVKVKAFGPAVPLLANLVQCTKHPLSPACRYYRMTVKDLSNGGFVMFGLTNLCLPGSPSWTIDRSVRYHSNDGGVFNGGLGIKTYHPYGIGDTITCRLDYSGPDRSLINFLLNDCLVYRQWVNLPPDQLYATVGLSRCDAELSVEWPELNREDIEIKKDLLSNWFGWTGITRDNEAMTFTLSDLDPNNAKREGFNVQCPLAFTKNFSYYEIEIQQASEGSSTGGHGVGLVTGNCDAFIFPGWAQPSIGYHSDDGGLYVNGGQSEIRNEFTCQPGDRLGCGVVFPQDLREADEREPVLVLVYFTKNRQLAYTKRMRQPRGGFFPCIAMNTKGDSVKLDVSCDAPDFGNSLRTILTHHEISHDYRCNETFQLTDLTQLSATIRMTSDTDTAQLLQFRAEPLRNLGDSFSVVVTEFGPDTEIQVGVSVEGAAAEGEFLGAEHTTCGFMLKLGAIVSKDGMRAVEKFDPEKQQKISCYLDYIDDAGAVLCFAINDRLIGRGVVTRATGCNSNLYATVVMSAGPATVKADWTGILNSTKMVRTQKNGEDWIRPCSIDAKGHTLERKLIKGSYAFAASAQSSLPLVTGSSIFSIRLLSGTDLPGIGVSRATNDVSSVLGAEMGEICFVPSGRHLLANNIKKKLNSTPEIHIGDTLQCGVVFTKPEDRVSQKVVVFFAVNSVILYHCTLQAAYGGLYPTVAFSSTGGSVEVIATKTVLPVPDAVSSAWKRDTADDNTDSGETSQLVYFHDDRSPSAVEGAGEPILPKAPTPVCQQINVYASHAFKDRERVDSIMKLLEKNQPYVAYETSTSRASMADKNEALARAELVVLFVGDAYYHSHEMLTEYTRIIKPRHIPAVLCALDNKGSWPPHTYFKDLEDDMIKLPWVELTLTDHGRATITPLERFIDKKLAENATSENSDESTASPHAVFTKRPSSSSSTKRPASAKSTSSTVSIKPKHNHSKDNSKTCNIV